MPFRLIQPYPDHCCPLTVPPELRVRPPCPVYFLRYRYPHHACASGFDRLCDFVAGETIQLPRWLYWLGETVLRLPAKIVADYGPHLEYSRQDLLMECAAIRHFLRHHDSVYHIIYAEKSYRFLRHITRRNRNVLIGTVHHPPEHNEWLFRSVEHFRRLDFVTVVSRAQLVYWQQVMGPDRVAYVPYAVDTDYFTPSERGPAQPPLCLFVGLHERDFETLERVIELVARQRPDVRFLMLSSKRTCGEIAARHPSAVWRRRVSDEEYRDFLRSASLLVLPLKRSTTNTAVLEALACGVPVVTTEGGIEDYLDSTCSLVRPVADAEGLAAAVLRLLNSPEEWSAFSRAARARAMEFSWPRTAQRMVEIYARLIRSHSAAV